MSFLAPLAEAAFEGGLFLLNNTEETAVNCWNQPIDADTGAVLDVTPIPRELQEDYVTPVVEEGG